MDMRKPLIGPESIDDRSGLVVEVIGPAAAGKTTLVRALSSLDDDIRVGVDVASLRYLGRFVRMLGSWMPRWIVHHRRDRWLSWRETKSVVFLDSWHPAVERRRARGATTTVLDHGAFYRLARLHEFGPQIVHTEAFERWWKASLDRWMKTIDVVIWLDASDDVLLRRVGHRGHQTLGSIASDDEKREFLARYRRAFDELFAEPGQIRPTIVRIHSDQSSAGAIAGQVMAVLRSHGRHPAPANEGG